MSARFDECMANAVDGGDIRPEDAARLRAEFERLRDAHATGSATTADAEARRALADMLKAESDHQKRKAKLALRSIQEIENRLRNFRTPDGRADMANGALAMLENFGQAEFGFSSVDGRAKSITAMAHARMEEMLHRFRRGAFGGDKTRWNRAQLPNVVREAFGEATGDPVAKALAGIWGDTAEWLRGRFNAAGGAIGKLEKWGLPQHHDPTALRKAGLATWREAIRPRLDLARMRHPLSGTPVSERELDGLLEDIWLTITTDGWIDRQPTRQAFGAGALANQRAEHRFLVFRNADDWLEYQRDFGQGDPFAAMMGHVNMMARDIAAMEVLGPNPSGTIEWLKQAVVREAQLKVAGKPARFSGRGNPLDRAARFEKRLDLVWKSIRGDLSTPVNTLAANTLGAARSIITSSALGSAAVSALSDIAFQRAARQFAFGETGNIMGNFIRAALPSGRREAVESGLLLDAARNVFTVQARYAGTLNGPEWANWLADRVLTVSGLTPWTQAHRHGFGLFAQTQFGKVRGKAMADLPAPHRRTLRRYGIDAAAWDRIRAAPAHAVDGVEMLRPNEIAKADPRLAERYLEMIIQETEYSTPNTSHRARTALLDQTQPGTFHGEMMRSFAQFKSFGAVVIMLHGLRTHQMLAARQTRMAGMAYAASLFVTATLLGGMSIQLKQVAAGRDPRAMDEAFWGAAMLQGGGLGIYGDFLFAEINRFGGGFASTLAGPLVGRANDFWNLTAGNAIQLASGETTNFGRELVRFTRGLVPGGNIWYLKLAAERLLLENINHLADPEADKAFRRQMQYWQRATGQEYWWRPGEMAPRRAPDAAAASPF